MQDLVMVKRKLVRLQVPPETLLLRRDRMGGGPGDGAETVITDSRLHDQVNRIMWYAGCHPGNGKIGEPYVLVHP